ncbi:MAG: phosphoglycerate dehydrogenase [Candidatus Omnitrophica bacterium]|nr:phosphoglycerate dehydrogenase [Candidatus Omnitrophota bacterium]
MKKAERIFIATSSFAEYSEEPLRRLKDRGFAWALNPHGRKLRSEEIAELAQGAVGIVAGTEKIDGPILRRLPGLKAISRCGAGIDNIDLPAAAELGVQVRNTPDAPTLAVAELTVGLMINLLRRVHWMDRDLRRQCWKKHMGHLLSRKKVGIIGFGRIGKKVAQLLKGFECELAYHDARIAPGHPGIAGMTLAEILPWADLLTVHISSAETVISGRELGKMKPGSFIINTSRGGVIDETALAEHLLCGHLAGAAVDVFTQEPYAGPLCGLEPVILTPHIGSYAQESRVDMEVAAVKNLLEALGENSGC